MTISKKESGYFVLNVRRYIIRAEKIDKKRKMSVTSQLVSAYANGYAAGRCFNEDRK